MGDATTALVVPIPEAEPLVGSYRSRHDPSGAWGMPAHVTILTPFVPPARLDDPILAELAALFADMPKLSCRFEKTGHFPGVLYLAPEPVDGFREMTKRLVERYPECPPYAGAHKDVVPHLTVLHDCADCLCQRVAPCLEAELPLAAQVTEVMLYQGGNEDPGWIRRARFPLGTPTA